MFCYVILFLHVSNEFCDFIPEPWRGDRHHTMSWIKIISHHKTWAILFITYLPPTYLFCITLFFGLRGVGILYVISKNYHMSVVTLISRKICDKTV
jgi:hypothetical protein